MSIFAAFWKYIRRLCGHKAADIFPRQHFKDPPDKAACPRSLSTAFCPTRQGLGHGLTYTVTTTTTPTGQEDTGQGRLRRPSLQVTTRRAPALFFGPTQIIYAPDRPSKRWQSACIPNDTRSVMGNNGPIINFCYLPNLGMVCRYPKRSMALAPVGGVTANDRSLGSVYEELRLPRL